ncbi:MAG: hypothetical protein A2W44_11755 [Acinetobacter sp. RIFCSPHIGHO2_12_41_5]|nr:MAG: hypothetical protein A2W44_11755 [Acinetobacter sp. RIFCSPHIGHO2_12_41_5]
MGFEGYDLIGTEGWTNPNSIYMQRTAYGHVVDGVAEIALMLYSFEAEENEYLFVSWGYDIEVFDKVISTFKFIDP